METPLINILTRTSGRPNAFKRCVESVSNQTYGNINHIIITDSNYNLEYINKYEFNDVCVVDREMAIKNDYSINPNTGKYSPHNLYFNGMKDKVKDGWMIYLDDDDYLSHDGIIGEVVDEINSVDIDTIIYWKMLYDNGNFLPRLINDLNPPRIGGIGSPCFTVSTKWLKDIKWDGWKCADFRVIDALHKTLPKYKWVDKVVAIIPSAGFGFKKDM